MRGTAGIALACLAIVALAPITAIACAGDWLTFQAFLHREQQQPGRPDTAADYRAVLEPLVGCSHEIDEEVASEAPLFEILVRALRADVENTLIVDAFVRYRCVYSMRNEDDYAQLAALIPAQEYDRLCNTRLLVRSRVVLPCGAYIRAKPAVESERAGWAKPNTLVEVVGTEGDWVRVRYHAREGFIRRDLLGPYEHGTRELLQNP